MKSILKKVLLTILGVIVLIGVTGPVAFATNWNSTSTMVMVDPNTHKTASTFYLYGQADFVCLKMNNDRRDQGIDSVFLELYSDANYTNKIFVYEGGDPMEKTAYITIALSFEKIKSGTYYAKTYIEKDFELDESTVKKYKIIIDKNGTDLNKMNAVMYGYANTQRGPMIYWYSVPGAEGYYLYKLNPETNKYVKIKTVKDNSSKVMSCIDSTSKDVTVINYYKVVAYNSSQKTPISPKPMFARVLKTPVVKVSATKDNAVTLTWSKVDDDAVYRVYVRTDDSEWKKIAKTKACKYVFSMNKYTNNTMYYFTVIAEKSTVESGYNVRGTAFKYLKYPELKACTYPDGGGVTINWKKVTGSEQYAVYRMESDNWKKIAVVDGTENSYTDTEASCYELNQYTVRSMVNGKLRSYSSEGKYAIKLEKLSLNEITQTDNKLKISWDNPAGEQDCRYNVYVKSGEQDKEFLRQTKNKYLFFEAPDEIETYTFYVQAVSNGFKGEMDDTGVSYTYFPEMHTPGIEVVAEGVRVSWKAMKGAQSYNVYKKTADGDFELLAETSGTYFIDTQTQNNVEYSYKVVYKYNDELYLEKTSDVKKATFIEEYVEFADEVHTITFDRNSYLINVDPDETQDCSYILFEKVDGVWKRSVTNCYINTKQEIPKTDKSNEFAFVKYYPDGRITRLPENGEIVDFFGCADEVSINKNKNIVTFSWDSENLDADKVLIYRNDKLIAEVPKSEGSFTHSKAKANAYNEYAVYTQKGNYISLDGITDNYLYLTEPEFTVSGSSAGILIKWKKPNIQGKVIIYKAKADGTGWTRIKTCMISDGEYTHEKVESGVLNTYTVRIQDKNGKMGPYDKVGKSAMYLDIPSFNGFKMQKNGLKINFSNVDGAKSYVIGYIDNSELKVLGEVEQGKTSFVDKTIKSGEKRHYRIMACNGENKSGVRARPAYYLSQPEITDIKSTSNSIKISYGKVEGAQEYRIYRKAGNETKWTLLTTTRKAYYNDKRVKSGEKYRYTVAAVISNYGGYKYSSSYNTTGKLARTLEKPKLNTISSTKSGVKFSWNKVSGATGYNVYRKTTDGAWEKLAYVKGGNATSYLDKSAKKGTTYAYTVQACYGSTFSVYNNNGLTCKDIY